MGRVRDETDLAEDQNDAAEEADGPAQLLLAREEEERLCRSNNEGQTREEEDLSEGRV